MPRRRREVLPLLLMGTLALGASPARAGGFSLTDQNAAAVGLGGAYVARGAGAAALPYNVAGLALAERPELVFGGGARLTLGEFVGEDPFPGALTQEDQKATPRFAPTFDLAIPIRERLVLGLGLHQPFSLGTEWDAATAFSGRYIAYRSTLDCYTLTAAAALKLADRLAVGAGLDVSLTSFELQRRLSVVNPFTQRRVDGADVTFGSDAGRAIGYRLGLHARPSEPLSLGVTYRRGVPIETTGSATIERLATGQAQLDNKLAAVYPAASIPFSLTTALPSVMSFGAAFTRDNWTVVAEVGLERWSALGTAALELEGDADLGPTTIARSYEDTLPLRLGVERRLNVAWVIRGGYSFEPSPMPTESLSPLFVDAGRHTLAFGAGLTQGRWRVDVASSVRLRTSRATEGASPEGYDGTYRNLVPSLSLTLGRTF